MSVLTQENAPVIQSLLNSVAMDKPRIGCTVKILTGKHAGKIGIVEKHIVSRFERAFRYGNEMSHYMAQARGRYGYAILVQPEDAPTFWTKADNVMVCCNVEWGH